ncbi:MAG: V-type ATPase 116kDa subunit family protein [Rikenellaceae bacterium]
MVTPMTKYTFLVHHLSVEQFIGQLGELGVVDVTVVGAEYTDFEKQIVAQINDAKAVRDKIVRFGSENSELCGSVGKFKYQSATEIISKFKETSDDIDKLEVQLSKCTIESREVEKWGSFDASLFDKLDACGVHLSFYSVSASDFDDKWCEDYTIEIVKRDAHNVAFVVISAVGDEAPDFGRYQPIKRPVHDVTTLDKEITELTAAINSKKEELAKIANNLGLLEDYIAATENSLKEELLKSGNQTVAEGKIYVVEGWVPEGKYDTVDAEFAEGEVVIFKDKPTLEDKPPILLKNNKFASMCEMISKLYSMPSYHELDLTPFFAPFFIFFVGFCLGDLGYAVLVLIAVLVAKVKIKDEATKPVLNLAMWCCFATMLMGAVTGNCFGIAMNSFEVFKDVKFMGQMDMFGFALVVGLVQILYAMFVKVYARTKYQGFKYAVSTLCWAMTIITCVVTYLLEEQGSSFTFSSTAFKVILGALLVLNVLFSDASKKNLLVNIGGGTWSLYNNVTGLLGDILSYIRLFALGLSSGIIASVFNDLAVGLSPDVPVVKYLVMIIILLIGHGINLFMSAIGSFVHPLRLTFVEFYNNAGFEGGGREYTPFKK